MRIYEQVVTTIAQQVKYVLFAMLCSGKYFSQGYL